MMAAADQNGNGELSVPPGFRFHPTDEELLYYYLRKKVSFEAIDLDVIREVDLNKLEPWDLKDKCRIGSGPQSDWYFFSHKDKKYPTGTRTNRATTAGFWKATGRDKAIHLTTVDSSSKRIGMRKTLVFYTGRAPHGQKTDWIMHEYRLDDDFHDGSSSHHHHHHHELQEDGWVVCRVFKKKNQISRSCFQSSEVGHQEEEEEGGLEQMKAAGGSSAPVLDQKQSRRHHHHHHQVQAQALYHDYYNNNFDGSMHLPQLFSPESAAATAIPPFISPMISLNSNMDTECSQNLLSRLTMTSCAAGSGSGLVHHPQHDHHQRFNGDWSFLDRLLASHQHQHHSLQQQQDHNSHNYKTNPSSDQAVDLHVGTSSSSSSAQHKFPFHYLGAQL